ncbi:hypothetical protein [Paenibacillus mendelii]|uniref:Uncharacterized protein n=1 Tax=Paenibacillus mendelii TaxID=206163 RepID=A0ABV6JCC4_9BACL|nr:hypothetical protein [Paenibacillus mendelii]MCQ6562995.1 hypothetical protein [Paenibacillus mendelii]
MTSYFLYHYYEKEIGPFRNLSSLSPEKADEISNQIRQEGKTFASQRSSDYLTIRRELESRARDLFMAKGGKPKNSFPHYMTLGACSWLESWFNNPSSLSMSWDEWNEDSISFTYGDLFPTMRYTDNKPYRKQVYTKNEIIDVIAEFGFPQEWNKLGDQGPERYIEVQLWDEDVIRRYIGK